MLALIVLFSPSGGMMKYCYAITALLSLVTLHSPDIKASEDTAFESKAVIKFNRFTLRLGGDLRLVAFRLSEIPVVLVNTPHEDAIGTEENLSARLRWKPVLIYEPKSKVVPALGISSEFDLIDGSAFVGSNREMLQYSRESRQERDMFTYHRIRLNKAYLFIRSPFFTFAGGRQKSHYGLGMLANSGDDDPTEFGVRRFGDIVDRALLTLRPARFFTDKKWALALWVTGAFDYIERDLFSDKSRADRAMQGLGTVQFESPNLKSGILYIYRNQKNSKEDRTKVHILDAFGSFFLEHKGFTLGLGAEWAMVRGTTQAARNIFYPDGLDVRSQGFIAQVSLKHKYFHFNLEIGGASGDENPFDGTYNTFTMNPDHRVGLILFPEYMKDLTAQAAWNATRPDFQGTAPRGVETLSTDGGVANAIYAFPRVSVFPLKHLELMLGAVAGRAAVRVVDPFFASVGSSTNPVCPNGGAVGPRCGVATKGLGYEIDTAVRSSWLLGPVSLLGAIEYGYFKPGSAFQDEKGNLPPAIHMVQGRVHLYF
jgi:hypothetical protein